MKAQQHNSNIWPDLQKALSEATKLPFQHSCSTSAIISLKTRFIYTDTICSPSSSKHLRTQLPVVYMLAAPNLTCQSASLFATQVTENRRIPYENKIKVNVKGSRLIQKKSLFSSIFSHHNGLYLQEKYHSIFPAPLRAPLLKFNN